MNFDHLFIFCDLFYDSLTLRFFFDESLSFTPVVFIFVFTWYRNFQPVCKSHLFLFYKLQFVRYIWRLTDKLYYRRLTISTSLRLQQKWETCSYIWMYCKYKIAAIAGVRCFHSFSVIDEQSLNYLYSYLVIWFLHIYSWRYFITRNVF